MESGKEGENTNKVGGRRDSKCVCVCVCVTDTDRDGIQVASAGVLVLFLGLFCWVNHCPLQLFHNAII